MLKCFIEFTVGAAAATVADATMSEYTVVVCQPPNVDLVCFAEWTRGVAGTPSNDRTSSTTLPWLTLGLHEVRPVLLRSV